jgi:hypothetical protein
MGGENALRKHQFSAFGLWHFPRGFTGGVDPNKQNRQHEYFLRSKP